MRGLEIIADVECPSKQIIGKNIFMVGGGRRMIIPHSGKWEEIGKRADNEANGRANTKGSAKDPFSRCCDVRVHFGISAVLLTLITTYS